MAALNSTWQQAVHIVYKRTESNNSTELYWHWADSWWPAPRSASMTTLVRWNQRRTLLFHKFENQQRFEIQSIVMDNRRNIQPIADDDTKGRKAQGRVWMGERTGENWACAKELWDDGDPKTTDKEEKRGGKNKMKGKTKERLLREAKRERGSGPPTKSLPVASADYVRRPPPLSSRRKRRRKRKYRKAKTQKILLVRTK